MGHGELPTGGSHRSPWKRFNAMSLFAAAVFAMPCLLMTVSLAAAKRLASHPGKDDLWQLPRPSSLR